MASNDTTKLKCHSKVFLRFYENCQKDKICLKVANEQEHDKYNNTYLCDQQKLRSAYASEQSDQS